MKIYEIPMDGKISLKLNKDDKSTILPARIKKITDKVLVLYPFIIDGKELSFRDEAGLVIDLMYEDNKDKPFYWRNVAHKMASVGGQNCLILAEKKDAVHLNRRGDFRLDMDVKGVLNRNENVIVHDISYSGVSFYTNMDNRKNVGDSITLKFVANYEDLVVNGKIVREVEADMRYLYGCTIEKSIQVDAFLIEEQRRRLQKTKKQ